MVMFCTESSVVKFTMFHFIVLSVFMCSLSACFCVLHTVRIQ